MVKRVAENASLPLSASTLVVSKSAMVTLRLTFLYVGVELPSSRVFEIAIRKDWSYFQMK